MFMSEPLFSDFVVRVEIIVLSPVRNTKLKRDSSLTHSVLVQERLQNFPHYLLRRHEIVCTGYADYISQISILRTKIA